MIEEKNPEAKNWNIGFVYKNDESGDTALQHALQLCKVFKAGLIIFSNTPGNDNKQFLQNLVTNINTKHKVRCNAFHLLLPYKVWLQEACIKNEIIILCIGHNKQRTTLNFSLSKSLRFLRKQKTPFLMIPEHSRPGNYSKIGLNLSFMKQEKEKILWASYFGRIHHSHIEILIPKAKDSHFVSGIKGNLLAMEKLYQNTEVSFSVHQMNCSVYKMENEAIKTAEDHELSAIIIMTSSTIDLFDIFEGSAEKKMIVRSTQIPMLCINPREDLYVLCS